MHLRSSSGHGYGLACNALVSNFGKAVSCLVRSSRVERRWRVACKCNKRIVKTLQIVARTDNNGFDP